LHEVRTDLFGDWRGGCNEISALQGDRRRKTGLMVLPKHQDAAVAAATVEARPQAVAQ
jgi:hypothetical protein